MAFYYDTDDIEEKEIELFDSDNISNDYSQFCCYDEKFDDWFDFIYKTLPQSKLKWIKFGKILIIL